jgi:hypothetical protein
MSAPVDEQLTQIYLASEIQGTNRLQTIRTT